MHEPFATRGVPVAMCRTPDRLTLAALAEGRGERVGSAGHPVRPLTTEEHRAAKAAVQARQGGTADPHGG